jgi:hypothetical protein
MSNLSGGVGVQRELVMRLFTLCFQGNILLNFYLLILLVCMYYVMEKNDDNKCINYCSEAIDIYRSTHWMNHEELLTEDNVKLVNCWELDGGHLPWKQT